MSAQRDLSEWLGGRLMALPEPLNVVRPERVESQRWHRLGRAAGELVVGYDIEDLMVRVEYHWVRWLSQANPALDDVYTAELWARQPSGGWLYLLRPQRDSFATLAHEDVRTLLARHLNVDVGA